MREGREFLTEGVALGASGETHDCVVRQTQVQTTSRLCDVGQVT